MALYKAHGDVPEMTRTSKRKQNRPIPNFMTFSLPRAAPHPAGVPPCAPQPTAAPSCEPPMRPCPQASPTSRAQARLCTFAALLPMLHASPASPLLVFLFERRRVATTQRGSPHLQTAATTWDTRHHCQTPLLDHKTGPLGFFLRHPSASPWI